MILTGATLLSFTASTSLVAATDASAPTPPLLEQQFFSNSTSSRYVNGKLVEASWFLFHFDVPNQRWRIEQEYNGDNVTQIYRLNDKVSYNIHTNADGLVRCAQLPVLPGVYQPNVTINTSATDLGPSMAGGQPAIMWESQTPVGPRVPLPYVVDTSVQAKAAKGRNPMGLLFNVTTKYAAGNCEPYTSDSCIVHNVRDNTRTRSVGPMLDWHFYLPEGFKCVNSEMDTYDFGFPMLKF